jgi:OMF family outer membrane factor
MVSFLCRVGLGIGVSMTVMGTSTIVLANEHSNLTIDHIPDPSFPPNEELGIPSLKAVNFTTTGITPTVQAQHRSIKENQSSTVSSSDIRPHLVVQSTQRTDTSPSSLNNPNLLESPTQPIEVKIQRTQAITLQESINLARRNNPSLQISALQLERSRSAVTEAKSTLFPTVSFQTAVTREVSATTQLVNTRLQLNGGTPISTGSGIGIISGDPNVNRFLNSTLELSYALFTSGKRDATIRAAEGQLRISQLDYQIRMAELQLDITEDYYGLQDANESVRIAKAAVTNAEKSLGDAQALERAGVGTRFAVLQSQVQLANARQELVRAESKQVIAGRQLVQRLNLSQDVDITAADKVDLAGQWKLGLEESIVLAFQNRAELQKQLLQSQVSLQQARAALAAVRPQINVFARYNLANNLDDNIGFEDGYAVGAQLTWNIFDGGNAQARLEQQQLNARIANTTFAETRNQIRFQVEQSFSNLVANKKY